MAVARTNPDPIAEVRHYLQGVAKVLVDRLYGPHGPAWGTRLQTLEDTIALIHSTLGEHLLGQALTRQSQACSQAAQAEPVSCPGCQRPTQARPPEPRVVLTDVGLAQWLEPQHYCPRCRRAFFPSIQEPRP